MNTSLIAKIMIVVSFFLFMGVGVWVSKRVKNAEDYYVMGRQAPTFLVTGTIVASYLSTTAFTGIFASAYNLGMGPGILNYGCLLTWTLLIFVLGPRVYRLKALSIPEILSIRYGTHRIRTAASILMILACSTYLVSIFAGAGIALAGPLGVSKHFAIAISGIVVLFFSVTGGMWGVVVTDTMMMVLFVGAAILGFPIALTHAGTASPAELVQAINASLPGAFKAGGYMPMFGKPFWSASGFVGFMGFMVLVSMSVGLTGAHCLSRTMICKNEKVVARSFIFAQLLVVLFLVLVYATAPFIKIAAPADMQGSQAYVWMVMEWFNPYLAGIILAGISAAGLSTASTLLQQAGSALGNDIYGQFFLSHLPAEEREKKVLSVSRGCMLVIGVLMLLISMVDMASDFFTLYSWAFASGIFVCWLPAIFIGSISKKVSEPAAYWSIIISLVLNIGYWLLTLTNPILPHQIYVALPASFIVLFVGMSRAAPTKAAEEGFWRMQSRQYKKVHGYVESK
ncbi:sodium:solute symporter family protein [Lacrimispora sp. 210928-DFI.3.58]|uniref:sodium:solute symporter family protein n=1 Tax=Lacrimispora sp. 210928-DFI.3.58 TaxID=2883214 RepID=UPI001D07F026|nr:sodium:solute symporter family protein [Lacrimispora sp. 210928-DFI.3.58]MCB7318230.1 sodium:solute symporter family protein [Lacrimispora sp. 210928-DFI.3.58]